MQAYEVKLTGNTVQARDKNIILLTQDVSFKSKLEGRLQTLHLG